MKKKNIIGIAVVIMALTSCSTKETALYSWHKSEQATYQYIKRTTEETLTKAMEQYEKVLKSQKGSRKIAPPGINAEYGFLLCKAGKTKEGIALLKEEIKHYPESEKFIARIIKQLEK